MKINECMTVFPHTIGLTATIESAERMMYNYNVRHLPVLDGGNLVGVLSEHDIELVKSLRGGMDVKLTVEDIYNHDALIFTHDASLAEVCSKLSQTKVGCALICENRQLSGIFTWVDALKILSKSESLRT